MARLLHLSDLHFGMIRPGLPEALIEQARDWRPDLTVVSGDLTQRARPGQFRDAAAFLAALPGPVISIPGNHDMPLWNPFLRLFAPFSRWRHFIAPGLEPMAETETLRVIGLNSADPYAWERGRIRPGALARLSKRLRAARPGQLRVVALHHPLIQPPQSGKAPMPGVEEATQTLAEAGADLVLCGHLHAWAAAPYAVRNEGRAILCVQSGTTLSTRLRGGANDLNLIDWHSGQDGGQDGGQVVITRMAAPGAALRFTPAETSSFHQPEPLRGWRPLPMPEAQTVAVAAEAALA
ncbi:metallophosphoesterase family protein [Xinfangfangia pollutisoli]|uniref:metallophosphoesterase family protein n=1 Tax=Xinfangfangia pollutisoli TaxID=2865960 RepID=UPI001CD3109C|nr:metallophosphoesterase family protein [Xinfangfangia pollutisoli]